MRERENEGDRLALLSLFGWGWSPSFRDGKDNPDIFETLESGIPPPDKIPELAEGIFTFKSCEGSEISEEEAEAAYVAVFEKGLRIEIEFEERGSAREIPIGLAKDKILRQMSAEAHLQSSELFLGDDLKATYISSGGSRDINNARVGCAYRAHFRKTSSEELTDAFHPLRYGGELEFLSVAVTNENLSANSVLKGDVPRHLVGEDGVNDDPVADGGRVERINGDQGILALYPDLGAEGNGEIPTEYAVAGDDVRVDNRRRSLLNRLPVDVLVEKLFRVDREDCALADLGIA